MTKKRKSYLGPETNDDDDVPKRTARRWKQGQPSQLVANSEAVKSGLETGLELAASEAVHLSQVSSQHTQFLVPESVAVVACSSHSVQSTQSRGSVSVSHCQDVTEPVAGSETDPCMSQTLEPTRSALPDGCSSHQAEQSLDSTETALRDSHASEYAQSIVSSYYNSYEDLAETQTLDVSRQRSDPPQESFQDRPDDNPPSSPGSSSDTSNLSSKKSSVSPSHSSHEDLEETLDVSSQRSNPTQESFQDQPIQHSNDNPPSSPDNSSGSSNSSSLESTVELSSYRNSSLSSQNDAIPSPLSSEASLFNLHSDDGFHDDEQQDYDGQNDFNDDENHLDERRDEPPHNEENEDNIQNPNGRQENNNEFGVERIYREHEESHPLLTQKIKDDYSHLITTPVGVSRSDILYMLIGMAKKNSYSNQALNDTVEFINTIFNQPVLPTSKYLLDKLIINKAGVRYFFYCEKCTALFGELDYENIKEKRCETCQTMNPVSDLRIAHFFCIFNFPSQLQVLLGETSIRQSLKTPAEILQATQEGVLSDLYDGSEYKKFAAAHIDSPDHVISLQVSTDGSPLFNSSKCSIWPISVAINELPLHLRMKKILLGGLWFGKKKPPMDLFLEPFVTHLASLSEGFLVRVQNEELRMRAFVIGCCVDSGARGQVQGLKTHAGYNSCNWCVIEGKYVSQAVRFPITEEPPANRTHEEIVRLQGQFINADIDQQQNSEEEDTPDERGSLQAANSDFGGNDCGSDDEDENSSAQEEGDVNSQAEEPLYGVNSVSPLINLPGFDMVKGFFVEPMHLLDLGITKTTLKMWTQSSDNPYSLSEESINQIDQRIESLRPPIEFRRKPRKMEEISRFKARELNNWLMFCIYPVFLGILDAKYLNLWLLFGQAVYLLSQVNVSHAQANVADALLKYFIIQSQEIHGESHMRFNWHILYHLGEHVSRWGPTWASSAYCFESFNGFLKKIIRVQCGIPHQVIRALSWEQCLQLLEPEVSEKARNFVKSLNTQSKRSKENHVGSCVLLGTPQGFFPDHEEIFLCNREAIDIKSCDVYKKFIKNNCVFAKFSEQGSTDNSVAQLTDKTIVLIRNIIYCRAKDKVFLFLSDINCEPVLSQFPPGIHLESSDHLMRKVISVNEEKNLLECEALKIVCFRAKLADGDFVAPLPNVYNVF